MFARPRTVNFSELWQDTQNQPSTFPQFPSHFRSPFPSITLPLLSDSQYPSRHPALPSPLHPFFSSSLTPPSALLYLLPLLFPFLLRLPTAPLQPTPLQPAPPLLPSTESMS